MLEIWAQSCCDRNSRKLIGFGRSFQKQCLPKMWRKSRKTATKPTNTKSAARQNNYKKPTRHFNSCYRTHCTFKGFCSIVHYEINEKAKDNKKSRSDLKYASEYKIEWRGETKQNSRKILNTCSGSPNRKTKKLLAANAHHNCSITTKTSNGESFQRKFVSKQELCFA